MTDPLFDLRGSVAVVIGGTGVLGSAISLGLACAGASVAVVGRSAERGAGSVSRIESAGGVARSYQADATSVESIVDVQRRVELDLGPVTLLVNAAGVNNATPFFDLGVDEWHNVIDTNLTSVLIACQVFGSAMVRNGQGGSIINLSSSSSGPPLSRVLAYSVAKSGVNCLTQYLALELAPHAIRVNAIAPGFFPAEQNRPLLSEERVNAILEHTPARRLGAPDELVGTVVWLAAKQASSFVTGAIVRVDGGFSAMSI